MTRGELLGLLIGQARVNGFEFRKWYVKAMGVTWVDGKVAVATLAEGRRYYSLLFSHEFAQSFWKAGGTITFEVPTQTFRRTMPDGSIRTVTRKNYTRRTGRPDAWKYHLKELSVNVEPLRYMRRYLRVEEDLDESAEGH